MKVTFLFDVLMKQSTTDVRSEPAVQQNRKPQNKMICLTRLYTVCNHTAVQQRCPK